MSTTTDSRVVELRFDNKEFEANAQQTINTLAQLKQALDTNIDGSAFDNLDRAARNVDLSGIQAGIEILTDRFSTMGIVGMTVIQNLTSAITNTLGRAISGITDSIVSGGLKRAQNIETAKFQLQGILGDAEKVTEVMNNASKSVDGTAYALDAAAKAASQLAASGVEAGDQMTSVLQGIAGVAATTSADYDSIAHIFTTAAGQGKIMTEQLRQLENRGLNAAATLANYFNEVRRTGEGATDSVKAQIAALTGATDLIQDATESISSAGESAYNAAKKAADNEYNLKKKAYDAEYKALQKSLNNQYNLKKAEYDKQYKALQESLNAELQAVQEANSKRIEELQEKYEADVEAYRAATEEKINLINEEYTESIKLIDEERYNKIKAVDEQIKAIQDQAKAEQKALKDQANAEKKAELESIMNNARNNKTKQQAAQVLADFEAELAREQLAEDRANQIEELQDQKTAINDEAAAKKEEAQKKAQEAKEAVQTESNAELKAMQKAHQEELTQLRKQQNEQVEAIREANTAKLTALRESQTEELSIYKEGQNEQLEVFREKQQEQLSLLKENQNEMLSAMKSTGSTASKYASKFGGIMDLTEADIREMVTNGLISFDMFSEAMAETFGEHAYDANKTFEGAMSNIRAALARTGEMFYRPLIEEGSPLIDLLNVIREKVNEFNAALKPVAHYITELIKSLLPAVTEQVGNISFKSYDFYHVWRGIYAIGEFMVSIFKAIGNGIKEAFDIDSTNIQDSAKAFQNFAESLKLTDDNASNISKIIKAIVKSFEALWSIVKRLVKSFSPLAKLFGSTSDDVLSLSGSLAEVIERFADWIESSKAVQSFFDGLTKVLTVFVDVIIKVKEKIKDLIIENDAFNVGKSFIQGFLNGVKSIVETVYTAIKSFATTAIEHIKKIFGIESPSTVMYEIGVNFVKGFINAVVELAKTIGTTVAEAFSKAISAIKETFSKINWGELFKDGVEASNIFITQFSENIRNGIGVATGAMSDFFTGIADFIKNRKDGENTASGYGKGFIAGIKEFASTFWEKTKGLFQNIFDKIHNNFDANSIKEGLANGVTYVMNFFKGIKDKLGEYLGQVSEWFKAFFSKIDTTGIATLATAAGAALGGLILIIKNLDIGSLVKMFKIIKPLVKIVNLLTQNMEKITSSEKFQELMAKFHLEGLDTGLNYVAGFIEGLKAKIPELIEKLKELGLTIINEVKTILGIQSPSTVMYAIGGFVVAGLILGIAKNIGGLRDKIQELFGTVLDTIKEQFDKIKDDLPAIAAVLTGIGTFAGLIILARNLKKIINPFQTLSSTLFSVKKALLGYQMDLKADALFKVAEAIALLASVILIMYEVTKNDPDAGKLAIFAGGVIAAMVLLTIALGLLTKITHTTKEDSDAWFQAAKGLKKALGSWGMGQILEKFGKAILEIVLAIVAVAKMYDKYPDATAKATGIIIAISVLAFTFAAASAAISQNVGEANTKINNAASSFLYIAAALLTITNAIQKIIDLNISWKKNKEQLIIVGAILAILTGIAVLLGKLNNSTEGNLALSGSAIFAFCILLYATLGALKRILEMDITKKDTTKLLVLGGIFLLLGSLINKMTNASFAGQGLVGAGGTLLGACAVILVTMFAMVALANMPFKQILKGIGSVGLILLVIAKCLNIASGVHENSFKTVIGMAAVVSILIAAIGVFSKLDTKNLILSAVSILIALVGLAAVFYAISKIGYSKTTKGAVLGMIAALILIAGGLFLLARFDWKNLLGAACAIAIVLLAYAKAFTMLSETSVLVSDVGDFLLGSLALLVIGGVLYLLSNQDWKKMLAAGSSIAIVLLAYAKAFKMIGEADVVVGDIGDFLLGSLALIIIGAAIAIAATQDWKSLLAAGAAISVTLLAYAEAFKLFGKAKVDLADVGNFVLGALSTIIIALALAIAASQPWQNLLAAGGAISTVLLLYAISFDLFSLANVSLEDVGNYILGTLSIIIISIALAIAASQPWDRLLAAGTAISEVLILYSVAMGIFSLVNISVADIGLYLLGCIAVVAVGAIVAEAAKQDWKSLLAAGLSISVTLIALSIAMVIASVAGALGEAAIAGIGVLDLFVGNLIAVLTTLGGLSKIPGFKDLIADGGELLVSVGTAIGNFVGSILGGALESISNGFPTIGENLTKFMENAQGFFDGLEQFDDDKVNAAKQLVALLIAFNVAEIINNLTTITDVLNIFKPSLADRFEAMGDSLMRFAKKTEGINGWNVKNAAQAVEALVSTMNSIGLFDFTKAKLLPWFGEQLAGFAEKLPTIVDNMADHDKSTYENVATAMTTMINVMDHIKARDFRDAEDLPAFGESLVTFAGYLRSIGRYSTDMNSADFQNLSDSAEIVIGIAKLIPYQQNGESLLGKVFGTNDIGEFGKKVHEFAKYMGGSVDGQKSIQGYAKSLNTESFQNLYNSASWLMKIATAIPETTSGLGKLFSTNDMATFGLQARNLAMYMAGIQEYLNNTNLNPEDFKNLKSSVQPLLDVTETIKKQMFIGEDKKFKPNEELKNFGEALKDFGKNVKECGNKAIEGYPGFSGAIELLQKLQSMMPELESFTGKSLTDFLKNLKQYGIDGLTNFLSSFTNSQETVRKPIAITFSNVSNEITSKRELMNSLGRVVIGYFINGIKDSNNKVREAADEIAKAFRNKISNSNEFREAGRDAGRGFANGLKDMMGDVEDAGTRLGNAAYWAAKRALDERSPSKKMLEVGSYAGEGFVNGFLDWLKASANAGTEIGNSATDSLKEALNTIGKEIQNEDDFNPTITPILDLSEVEKNASAISGLLNLDRPISLASSAGLSFSGGLNNLLSNIQASIPDNNNYDVVTAINSLRSDVNSLGDKVASLQVVMDTGELVGVLTDPIDEQIGFNSTLIERGVR